MNTRAAISDLLKELGVPAHVRGYKYLRRAIEIVYETPSGMSGVTTVLYPTIAKEFGTSVSCVERAIRHAIEISWDRGNVDKLNELFRYSHAARRGKATNGEYIATVADYLYVVLS